MSFYTAVSVYAPAIALSKATGLNTRVAVLLIYLVCIFYSSQGGMKAVVIADTFQVNNNLMNFDKSDIFSAKHSAMKSLPSAIIRRQKLKARFVLRHL